MTFAQINSNSAFLRTLSTAAALWKQKLLPAQVSCDLTVSSSIMPNGYYFEGRAKSVKAMICQDWIITTFCFGALFN